MITHIIYHIPGRKVGCTRDLQMRKKFYFAAEGANPEIEVLEEIEDATDQQAGDIEWQWADRFGYKRGHHYTKTLEFARLRGRRRQELMTPAERTALGIKAGTIGGPIGGPIGGKRTAERLTKEQKTEKGRIGGLRAAELKVTGFFTMTVEKQSEAGRLGGARVRTLMKGIHSFTHEQRVEVGRRGGSVAGKRNALAKKGAMFQIVECPHCGITSTIAILKRWHFDNCRHR